MIIILLNLKGVFSGMNLAFARRYFLWFLSVRITFNGLGFDEAFPSR